MWQRCSYAVLRFLSPRPEPADIGGASRAAAGRLFALGFLTLFLELVLIRFFAGTIWNLGYFPNLVLLAVFVGMGVGFIFHTRIEDRHSAWILGSAPAFLALVCILVQLLRPAVPGFDNWLGNIGGEVYYTDTGSSSTVSALLAFPLWFLFVVLLFVMISQRTAKLFRLFPPLSAYTLDIGGSCCGILAFMGVSWLGLPAWSWFLLASPLFVWVQSDRLLTRRFLATSPLLLVAFLAWRQDTSLLDSPGFGGDLAVRWSPYQKVECAALPGGHWALFVNGIGHQSMLPQDVLDRSYYPIPHRFRRARSLHPYRSVLVIGAGAGNDVAAALQNGAEHVDAVEIDPAIARFGREWHPVRPYDDPRVTLTITDARAFMTRTRRRYDLIVFALTDSLVKVSPLAQLRLENYLYTEESVRRARELLTEAGDVVLYNSYRLPWVLEKNQLLIRSAFGRSPGVLYRNGDFVMLLVGKAGEGMQASEITPSGVDVTTDDWPFPYLRRRGIPSIYGWVMAGLALVVGLLMWVFHRWEGRRSGSAGDVRLRLAFVIMGLAFLLLETKGVIQFSLLFGTTWLNNSLVFLAVLTLVLLANWVARYVRGRWLVFACYASLIVFCGIALAYPLSRLLHVPSTTLRFVVASVLTFSPIFFANVIFSATLRDQSLPELLFGWNLLGATLGGVVEYASMVVGYNTLAVIVGVCYTIVFLLLMTRPAVANAPDRERAPA